MPAGPAEGGSNAAWSAAGQGGVCPPGTRSGWHAAGVPAGGPCVSAGGARRHAGREPAGTPGADARFRVPRAGARGGAARTSRAVVPGPGAPEGGEPERGSWDASAPAGQAGAGASPEAAEAGRQAGLRGGMWSPRGAAGQERRA